MKKMILAVLAIFAITSAAFAFDADIRTPSNFGGTHVVTASSSYEGYTINSSQLNGSWSVQATLVGEGTADVKYQVSNFDADSTGYPPESSFVYPDNDGSYVVLDNFTKTSGASSNGKTLKEFVPPFAKYMRVVITEVGGASPITATVQFANRREVY